MPAVSLAQGTLELTKDELADGIVEMLPGTSDLFKMVKNSWEGVETALGRPARTATGDGYVNAGYIKRWTIGAGGGGFFKMTDPNPLLVNSRGSNHRTFARTTTASFPTASEFVWPGYANPYVGLAEGRGVLAVPWQLLRSGRMDSAVLDIAADNVQKAADNTAFAEAASFFSRNPQWGELLRTQWLTGATPSSSVISYSSMKLSLLGSLMSECNVTMLRPGLSVDIWHIWHDLDQEDVISYRMHDGGWIVDTVDYVNETATFVTKDGAVMTYNSGAIGMGASGAAGDKHCFIVTLKDWVNLAGASASPWTVNTARATISTDELTAADNCDADLTSATAVAAGYVAGFGCDGLVNFLKTSSSQSFYGVPCSSIPTLLATYVANLGDYLSERRWNRILGQHRTQLGARFMPDTVITTFGVVNGALQNQFNFGSATVPYSGGTNNVFGIVAPTYDVAQRGKSGYKATFTDGELGLGHGGQMFNVLTDSLAMRKNLFSIITRDNNLKRLIPPPVPGSGRKSQFGSSIEFMDDLAGNAWDWARASGGGKTDFLEANYIMTCQHFMEMPQGIRIRGITESIGLS